MFIIEEIKKIIESDNCTCYSFDESNLTVIHTVPMEEARYNDCNNRIFTQITGLLVENDVDYEVNGNNDIVLLIK